MHPAANVQAAILFPSFPAYPSYSEVKFEKFCGFRVLFSDNISFKLFVSNLSQDCLIIIFCFVAFSFLLHFLKEVFRFDICYKRVKSKYVYDKCLFFIF